MLVCVLFRGIGICGVSELKLGLMMKVFLGSGIVRNMCVCGVLVCGNSRMICDEWCVG